MKSICLYILFFFALAESACEQPDLQNGRSRSTEADTSNRIGSGNETLVSKPSTNLDNRKASQTNSPRKRALMIAIADYLHADDLNSNNDIPLIRDALLRHGFKKADLSVLADQEASRAVILKTLFHEILPTVKRGDIFVMSYSGHGTQIADDDGDEIDSLDEALVPYDAGAGGGAEQFIRDDTLGVFVENLRKRIGPEGNVFFIIDACYSGSIARDFEQLQGRNDPFRKRITKKLLDPEVVRNDVTIESGSDPGRKRTSRGRQFSSQMAPFVIFTAAAHNQVNREVYKDVVKRDEIVGPLSLAVHKALADANSSTTYRMLFERVRMEMIATSHMQTPQMEGDVDALLFSGEVVEPKPYLDVVKVINDSTIRIEGGRLNGLNPGSRVMLHPISDLVPIEANALANGRVVSAQWMTSKVVLDRPISIVRYADCRVFVSAYSFGELYTRVVYSTAPGSGDERIHAMLRKLPGVELVERDADILIRDSLGRIEIINAIDAVSICSIGAGEEGVVDKVYRKVVNLVRNNYLRRLNMRNNSIDVQLILTPVQAVGEYELNFDDRLKERARLSKNNKDWRLSHGQSFSLKAVNRGLVDAYITVLSLQPDGELHQLFPVVSNSGREIGGQDNVLKAGADYTFQYAHEGEAKITRYDVQDTPGKEVLMLIATPEPVRLDPIIRARGPARNDKAYLPLEQLFAGLYLGDKSTPAMPCESSGSTEFVTIEIP